MFCHKCGSKALDGAVFCQKCGAKLIKENDSVEKPDFDDISSTNVRETTTSQQSKKEDNDIKDGKGGIDDTIPLGIQEDYDLLKQGVSRCPQIKKIIITKGIKKPPEHFIDIYASVHKYRYHKYIHTITADVEDKLALRLNNQSCKCQ